MAEMTETATRDIYATIAFCLPDSDNVKRSSRKVQEGTEVCQGRHSLPQNSKGTLVALYETNQGNETTTNWNVGKPVP